MTGEVELDVFGDGGDGGGIALDFLYGVLVVYCGILGRRFFIGFRFVSTLFGYGTRGVLVLGEDEGVIQIGFCSVVITFLF